MYPEVFSIDALPDGGYSVRVDCCFQPNDPAFPGDVRMDMARAREVATELAIRLGYKGIPE